MSQALLIPGRRRFNPASLGNLYAFFDAGGIAGADGDRIAQWNDLSGNGRHVAQATAGKQPALAKNLINGRSAVRFANSRADALAITGLSALPWPMTVLMVVKTPTTTPAATQYFMEGASGNRRGVALSTARTINHIATTSSSGTSAVPTSTPTVLAVAFDGASSLIRERGVQKTNDVGAQTNPTQFVIGARYDQTAAFDGWIAEVAIYSRHLSAGDLARWEAYAAAKYALPLARDAIYYVDAGSGSDSNHGRLPDSPFLTLAKAKSQHGIDFATAPTAWYVTAPEATPFRELVTWDKDVSVTVAPATAGQRWYHYASEKFTSGWTAVSGGVYSRAHSAYDPTFAAFVSDVANGDGLWTPLVLNTATPTAPGAGEYGWSSNVLYVHLADGSDPNTHVIEVAKQNYCWIATEDGTVAVTGGSARGGRIASLRAGGSLAGQAGALVATDMIAEYSANGIATGGTYTSLRAIDCIARGNLNDGFNIHGDAGNTGPSVLTDCEGAYNGDEGYSCHDDTVSTGTGGRLHHNGSGGATHVNQANVTMSGVEVDQNQRDGDDVYTGGITYADTASGAVTGCDVHDNPSEGIKVFATAHVTVSGNTSGTAAGNGQADNLAA